MKMMARYLLVAATIVAGAWAQTEQPATDGGKTARPQGGSILDSGAAERLDRAMETILPQQSRGNDLAKIAEDMTRRMQRADPHALGEIEERLRLLQSLEDELVKKLDDWRSGKRVELEPWWETTDSDARPDRATLELETTTLLATRAEFERAEEKSIAAAYERERKKESVRPVRSAAALLNTLEDVPTAPAEKKAAPTPVASTNPDRLARALYKAQDFVGALTQFRAMKPEDLTDSDRYSLARCLEETGDPAGAVAELEKLVAAAKAPFWKERAENLKRYLQRERAISGALK